MHRSSLCGEDTNMTISTKNGALVNASNVPILFNNSGATSFRLAAELKNGTFDWSRVAQSVAWRDTPMTDAELAAIPPFAEYSFELWLFGPGFTYRSNLTNATTPDVTYRQRMNSRPLAISALKNQQWNILSASDFLNPFSLLFVAQSTVSVNWNALAEPVDFVGVAGAQLTATTTSATSVVVTGSASVGNPQSGVRSISIAPTSLVAGTASLAGIGGVNITIPNCSTITQFPPLDIAAGTKITGTDNVVRANGTARELVIRSHATNRAHKFVTRSWNNFID